MNMSVIAPLNPVGDEMKGMPLGESPDEKIEWTPQNIVKYVN